MLEYSHALLSLKIICTGRLFHLSVITTWALIVEKGVLDEIIEVALLCTTHIRTEISYRIVNQFIVKEDFSNFMNF